MPRARDLGISFEGTTGPLNAITDVQGVEVGHATLNSGKGKLQVGKGPVKMTGYSRSWRNITGCLYTGHERG
jgi:L-aminopeptidase/D-esterase-like protein